MLNSKGIEASNLYQVPEKEIDNFPGSKEIKDTIVTLPCHPKMAISDIVKTISIIKNFYT